jgi:hypothetical protein
MTVQLYRNEYSNAVADARRNLMGRTHYVDPDTMRLHKSRILCARVHADGLLYSITESCAADMNNRKRVFRCVIFDINGTVLYRPSLEDSCSTRDKAEKAMFKVLEGINAFKVTHCALVARKDQAVSDYKQDMADLKAMLGAGKAKAVE